MLYALVHDNGILRVIFVAGQYFVKTEEIILLSVSEVWPSLTLERYHAVQIMILGDHAFGIHSKYTCNHYIRMLEAL